MKISTSHLPTEPVRSFAFAFALAGLVAAPSAAQSVSPAPLPSAAQAQRCLKAAYPGIVCSVDREFVRLCDGQKVPFAPSAPGRSHQAQLLKASVAEQLAQPYALGRPAGPPKRDEEPGRIRSQAFFKAVYGDTRRDVARRVKAIRWMAKTSGKRLRVSTVAGASKALERVGKALDRLPSTSRKLAASTSGTFVWRTIRGTSRLSAHSFGIAVDVAVNRSDYWRWGKPAADGTLRYRNRIPWDIVAAFEREGFVWGGKWYRYDTMHFEYRPELIIPQCRKGVQK